MEKIEELAEGDAVERLYGKSRRFKVVAFATDSKENALGRCACSGWNIVSATS